QQAARHAASKGLTVHAGHGLNYYNVQAISRIPQIVELNIGHPIVARAVIDGMAAAVSEMKRLMLEARRGAWTRHETAAQSDARYRRGRMIFGIGTDVVQIERVKRVYERHGERFVERLLLPAEYEAFRNY